MQWYVIHTYAAREFKIKEALEKGIKDTGFADKVGRILIPVQQTFHIRDGKRVEREKKIFNSYVIIEADLTSEVKSYILNLPGVTNFLGVGKEPQALSEAEVNRLLGISERDKSTPDTYDYFPGDIVKIISGPFTDFEGTVDKLSEDKKKLTIKVTVFGRATPVEVRTDQVEVM